ncbi:MAG: LapA family protein [Candidatus Moranbacteria bacterium]|nr:LapA family protein [Candidatus Moranbacteria bacterium]
MKSFVAIVFLSMGLTFFVISNADPVPLHFFEWSGSVPLPFILVFPTGTALLVFSLYYWRQMSKSSAIIHELENELETEQKKVLEVLTRTHELELENRKMSIRLGETQVDEDSL